MGWNGGYTIFESTVIGAYDLGVLNKKLMAVLMEPYRDTDIDSGGSRDLLTKDGKNVEQVVIETYGLSMPPKPDEPYDYDSEEWEKYFEEIDGTFRKVTSTFGW